MTLPSQIQSYLSELSERLGKTESEVVALAVFELYNDKHKFIFSPHSNDMWFKDEIPSTEDVVDFTDSTGKDFKWVQFPDTEESRKVIGTRIKELREQAGMSQDQLGEFTGLLKQNISRIEQGKYSTGQDILSKIAQAFGKRLDII